MKLKCSASESLSDQVLVKVCNPIPFIKKRPSISDPRLAKYDVINIATLSKQLLINTNDILFVLVWSYKSNTNAFS